MREHIHTHIEHKSAHYHKSLSKLTMHLMLNRCKDFEIQNTCSLSLSDGSVCALSLFLCGKICVAAFKIKSLRLISIVQVAFERFKVKLNCFLLSLYLSLRLSCALSLSFSVNFDVLFSGSSEFMLLTFSVYPI